MSLSLTIPTTGGPGIRLAAAVRFLREVAAIHAWARRVERDYLRRGAASLSTAAPGCPRPSRNPDRWRRTAPGATR
jgi:hypothetical protein